MDTQHIESTIKKILNGDAEQNLLSLEQLAQQDFAAKDPEDLNLKTVTETKSQRCSELSKTISEIQNIIKEEENHHFLDTNIHNHFQSSINELRDIHNKLEENIQGSKTDTNLRSSRFQITGRYKHLKDAMEANSKNHKINNTIFELAKFLHTDSMKKQQKRMRELDEMTERLNKDIESLQNKFGDTASAASRQEAGKEFIKRAQEHRKYAWVWFGASCIFLGLFFATVIYNIKLLEIDNTDTLRFALTIFGRLLLITVFSVALKICITKYNSERHLEITYQHRIAALDQYGTFDKAISSDEAKNKLRLSLANIIFNDPQTGLVKGDKDLNISSNLNMAERLTKEVGS